MRVIRLDGSEQGKRSFVHLFSAVRSQPVAGIDQIRVVGKLMDKIEAVGVKTGEAESEQWQLAPGGGEIWLEGPQFAELRARLNAAKWPPDAARFVAKTFDLVENAPEEEPGKPRIVPDPLTVEATG